MIIGFFNCAIVTSHSTPKLPGYSVLFPGAHSYILTAYGWILENDCLYFNLTHGKGKNQIKVLVFSPLSKSKYSANTRNLVSAQMSGTQSL